MLVENDFFFKENRILKNVLLHKSESHEKKSTVIKLKVAKLWKKKMNTNEIDRTYSNHISGTTLQKQTFKNILQLWYQ